MFNHLYDKFKDWYHTDELGRPRGSIYFYSDPHFADDEMKYLRKNYIGDDEQVKRINAKVGKYDTIVFLGDIGDLDFVKKIKGYKVLIMGNHDAGETNYNRVHFKKEVRFNFTQSQINAIIEIEQKARTADCCADFYSWSSERAKLINRFLLEDFKERELGEDWHIVYTNGNIGYTYKKDDGWYYTCEYDNHLFDEVYPGILTVSEKVILSHEPVEVAGMFNIHGHTHGLKVIKFTDKKSGKELESLENIDEAHYCVCAEFIEYTPVPFKSIIEKGYIGKIESIHRTTIDNATTRKRRRENKDESPRYNKPKPRN